MSRGINKVILVGNLGQDPEVRFMPDGSAVANFSIATSESWKDKQTGEQKERTEWHRITMYQRLAEIAGQYLRKGAKVYIEGKLQTRKWQDKNGEDRYTTEIIAGNMQMLSGREDNQQNQPQYAQGQQQTQSGFNQQQGFAPAPNQNGFRQQQGFNQSNQSGPQGGNTEFDDDIPF